MKRMFKCYNCGKLFDWPKEVEESRGEYWGIPCYEKMYYSPCCNDDFVELEVDENGNPINEEEE